MIVILYILGAIVGIIALLLLLALFTKKEYTIQREIVIEKPIDEVFNYIKQIKNQDYFSKWVMTDPNMNRVFTGNDGEVGFIYAWDSQNKAAGKGEQEIKNIIQNELLDLEIRFEKPMKGLAKTPFRTTSISANETKVNWGMESKMNYPMNAIMLFVNFENILGKDLEISLNNLKTILEAK
ncbi:MAG: SRPBCC family protein [Flavobacteriia bacterium]|jgi:uncharacterized protein YndB with AHSA1/START domain